MKKVTLTNGEMMTCRLIGNMRTMSNRGFKVNDMQMGKQDPWDTDEWGVVGEYAFCKMNNIFFDFSVSPRSGSFDCLLKGVRVDIKTTILPNGQLVARSKRNPDVDVFVLAILTGNVVTFPGFCSAENLYQEENLTDLRNGKEPAYVMPQSKLRPWADEEKKDGL
jgi:hypothetical protein